jgi:hypothetical protein
LPAVLDGEVTAAFRAAGERQPLDDQVCDLGEDMADQVGGLEEVAEQTRIVFVFEAFYVRDDTGLDVAEAGCNGVGERTGGERCELVAEDGRLPVRGMSPHQFAFA